MRFCRAAFGHEFDRGGHYVRKNPGALRTAGNEDPQLAAGTIREGHPRGLDHHRTNRVSGQMRLRRQSPGEPAKHLETFGDRVDPRSEKPIGAADDGIPFMQKGRHAKPGRRQHRRNGRVAAKANHRARADPFEKPARGNSSPD